MSQPSAPAQITKSNSQISPIQIIISPNPQIVNTQIAKFAYQKNNKFVIKIMYLFIYIGKMFIYQVLFVYLYIGVFGILFGTLPPGQPPQIGGIYRRDRNTIYRNTLYTNTPMTNNFQGFF